VSAGRRWAAWVAPGAYVAVPWAWYTSATGRAALWGGGVGVDAGGVCGAGGAGGACGKGAVPWGLGGVMRVCAVCAPCPGPKPKSRAPATATAISATRMNNRLGPLDDVVLGNRGSLPLVQRDTAISPFGTNLYSQGR